MYTNASQTKNSTDKAGIYLGSDGLNISGGTAAKTVYINTDGNVRIGDKLTWNGTTLSITGAVTATTLSTGEKTSATTAKNGIFIDSSGNMYVGSANKFKVTNAGAITATSGTIAGFTITDDTITTNTEMNHVNFKAGIDIGPNGFIASGGTEATSCYMTTTGEFHAGNVWINQNTIWVDHINLSKESLNETVITSFSGSNISSGSIKIIKKFGWCLIYGGITINTTVPSDWVRILDTTKIPTPEAANDIYVTAVNWGTSYTRPLRLRISGKNTGLVAGYQGLSIRYGAASTEYQFQIFYPVEDVGSS